MSAATTTVASGQLRGSLAVAWHQQKLASLHWLPSRKTESGRRNRGEGQVTGRNRDRPSYASCTLASNLTVDLFSLCFRFLLIQTLRGANSWRDKRGVKSLIRLNRKSFTACSAAFAIDCLTYTVISVKLNNSMGYFCKPSASNLTCDRDRRRTAHAFPPTGRS